MNDNHNTIIAIFFSFLSLTLFATPCLDGVTRQKYPDADAVTVEEIEKVSYNPDGTSETYAEAWTKILTEKGRREESLITLHYSKRYGSARILYVGAIDAQGREREINVAATTKESTDNSSVVANIYDPLDRQIACTIPGLKIGETVHIKIHRKTDKSRIKNHWADICIMEWKAPILKSVYEVKAPASRPIRAKAIRNPLGNVTETVNKLADGSMQYIFTATNSPQMFPEPDMPPAYTQVQNIRLSTAASWREISKWYWDLCVPHLEKTNAAMTNKVAELKGTLKGEALVRAVFKFVSQEIRYMGLTMEDTSPGYAPHDVDVTFDNRYGVCRDKAGLLVAMLRIAGVEAFPVLINVGAKMDKEVPQPYFNHAIVAAQLNGKYILMDPTNENTKDIFPAYLSNKSYLVCRKEGEELMTTPVPPSADNAVIATSRGRLSDDGVMMIENKIDFLGVNDTIYRGALARRTPEERNRLFERIVARFSAGAEMLSCEIEPEDMRDTEKPLSVKIVSRIPEAALKGRTQIELLTPMVSKAFGYVNFLLEGSTSLAKRKYPLVLDTTAETRETLKVSLGDLAGSVKSLPPAITTTNGYDYSRKFTVKDGELTVERRLAISAMEFSPAEYEQLREEIKQVEATERKRPVFVVNQLADADTEVLLERSETSILSPAGMPATDWVTTNEVVKRVLTYAGKKSESEIKLNYNPAWKKVSVITATVSNANGRVYSVSPKEMNVLDAGWVAAAPRYSAGKMLVVNLPSVEIGSIITLKTATEVKGAPMPFYATYLFDSKQPLRCKSVRVDDWRREVVEPARIPDERHQPNSRLWRDAVTVSKCDWETAAKILKVAAEVPRGDYVVEGLTDMIQIRNWMAKHVRVAGPGLYDAPLAQQLTDPAVILRERYATRIDYVRTLAALLDNAGYDVRIVFAANNADADARLKEINRNLYPYPHEYCNALCRVTVREGGFLGLGGVKKVYYFGTENEYTPLGATSYDKCDWFDALSGEFGIVDAVSNEMRTMDIEESEYTVRENGAVDIDVKMRKYGAEVGGFRKRFAEILPEEFDRCYQALLGDIAQAASAIGELIVDTESYPAEMSFKCFVPDFATVEKGVITLQLPDYDSSFPTLSGTVRRTPFAIPAADRSEEIITVRFPEGYTVIEHIPEEFSESNHSRVISSKIENGRLVMKIAISISPTTNQFCPVTQFAWQKDICRIWTARANRTIVVRKN